MDCLTPANIIETRVCHHEKNRPFNSTFVIPSAVGLRHLHDSSLRTDTRHLYRRHGTADHIRLGSSRPHVRKRGKQILCLHAQGNVLRPGKPRLLPALLGMARLSVLLALLWRHTGILRQLFLHHDLYLPAGKSDPLAMAGQ